MPKPMREVRNSKNIHSMLLIDLAYAIYSHTNAGKYIGSSQTRVYNRRCNFLNTFFRPVLGSFLNPHMHKSIEN